MNGSRNLEVTVRPAQPSDAQALAVLSRQLGYEASDDEMRSRLQRLEATTDHVVLVACTPSNSVVGWIHACLTFHLQTGDAAEIAGLVIAEGVRSRGLGRLLVEHAEAWVRGRGAKRIRVRSNVKRTHAHHFYEREKYVRTKTSAVFDKEL